MFGYYPFWMLGSYPNFKVSVPTKIVDVDLDDITGNERVVIFQTPANPQFQFVDMQKKDPTTGKWESVYKVKFDRYSNIQVQNHYWNAVGRKAVIISSNEGSGNILNYVVLTEMNEKVTVAARQANIFQGSVWFEEDSLMQSSGNRYWKWRVQRRKLVLAPIRQPLIPGAKTIEYAITPDETVHVKKSGYTINVGDIVQFIRVDNNDIVERIMYMGGHENLQYIPHRSAFKANYRTTVTVDIVPGGYDWDKKKEITIQVI